MMDARHNRIQSLMKTVYEREGRPGVARVCDAACSRCRTQHGLSGDKRCHPNADPFDSLCPAIEDVLELDEHAAEIDAGYNLIGEPYGEPAGDAS